MADYKKLVPFIKKWEGGYVDDPDDLGGQTNMGITLATLKTYYRDNGMDESTASKDIKNLSEEVWSKIFETYYWDRWKADVILSQGVANMLVDWVWASGVHGVKRPQKLLGVTVDGLVGERTLRAVNLAEPKELFERIKKDRIAFIDEICLRRPANEKFRRGWLNRINDIPFE